MRQHTSLQRTAAARLLLAFLLALLPLAGSSAQQRRGARPEANAPAPRTSAATAQRPRLVLLIAVDQFRYDYLERFGDLFAANGLRRLLRDGASWTDANYDHVPTETAPGHATMMTGAWPSETGIIANEWFDRAEGRRVNNVQDNDKSVQRLGGDDGDPISSPSKLLSSTLGDELKREKNSHSKVIGISIKDRAAILPAGRGADAAYWYSSKTGEFVSSTYYFKDLPKWVKDFNAEKPARKFCNKLWERLLPVAEYEKRAGRDDAPWEKGDGKTPYKPPHDGKTSHEFPHVVPDNPDAPSAACYDAINYTPFSNDLLISYAEAAITNEHLGEDADTDVLTVSFSANDIVGHRYGPNSHELMDMTLRVDQQIGQLLDFIDRDPKIGLQNTVVIFTADHGVAPSPEQPVENDPPGQQVEKRQPGGRVKVSDVMKAVCKSVREHFGKPEEKPVDCDKDTSAGYGLTFSNGQIYFGHRALERDGIKAEDMERVVGEAALTVRGISRYFGRTQLMTNKVAPEDALARRVLHGFNPARSGDVVVIQEAYKYLDDGSIVATHGTPYLYDTHVPVIIMGGGVAPGRYLNAATPADIAPTLARILRVQAPSNAVGRVLSEAIK